MTICTYHKVAENDLEDLGLERGAALEERLHDPNKNVAHGSANQSTVGSHLGHARGEVVAVLVAVLGEERGQELLDTGQGTGSQHLGAERVGLELLDVGLRSIELAYSLEASGASWQPDQCA